MSFRPSSTTTIATVLIVLTLFTRFIKLDWGDGYYFHPDEGNMARSLSQLTIDDLNPRFFAYGQFPLYLVFFPLKLLSLPFGVSIHHPVSYSTAVISLRILSALSSVATIFVFYLISRRLFSTLLPRLLFLVFLIFTPGLIQLAHFGTTESLLLLAFSLNIYLSFKLIDKPSLILILFASLVSGAALATKLTAIFFISPILLSFLINLLRRRHLLQLFGYGIAFILLGTSFFFVFSPYNLIEYQDFVSAFRYELAVATGATPVFYVNQFIATTPYLFQLKQVFPYSAGLFLFVAGLLGIIIGLSKNPRYFLKPYWLLVIVPSLFYFFYNGRLYVKWTRFCSPVFFIFPLFSAYLISRIRDRKWVLLLALILVLPGVKFLHLYLRPDVRLTTSHWLVQNLPPSTTIFSEAGNVINLPVTSNDFRVINFDFYNLDKDPRLQSELPQKLAQSDYLLIPSRRIYKNQSTPQFPYSYRYYQALFSGSLGFDLIAQFSNEPSLWLNSENAEETWSVFDHPVIRVYQKTRPLTLSQYQELLL